MQLVAGAAFALVFAVVYALAQPAQPYVGILDEHPVIRYAAQPPNDDVAALIEAIRAGGVTLRYKEANGYLDSVLDALNVSRDSQVLIFSKTGIQRRATSPLNPRAIYFNDSVVVGYIPGAPVLEIAAHDPQHGV